MPLCAFPRSIASIRNSRILKIIMNFPKSKQPTLKPQDLLVSLKVAVQSDRQFTYAELASELFMSVSEVHAAVRRAEISRLLNRSNAELRALRSSLHEFLIHGIQYTFPAVNGPLTRGMPTGFAGPLLKEYFMATGGLPPVWPDPEGDSRGISLQPIYHSVPAACRLDHKLYAVLTLVDALRGGSARERELSASKLMGYLK